MGNSGVGYMDETHQNAGRYRAVALVTLDIEHDSSLSRSVAQAVSSSSLGELKWVKLNSANCKLAALGAINAVVRAATEGIGRVDVLVWDVEDSRHAVHNRSDVRNLRRMYYFLLRSVLSKRRPKGLAWTIYPDDTTEVSWDSLESYLSEISDWNTGEHLAELTVTMEPSASRDKPLIQVADLFAGLAVYSRASHALYKHWDQHFRAGGAARSDAGSAGLSNRDRERCQVIAHLHQMCKDHRLGVSLSGGGLRTRDPRKPLNFWWYEPQTAADRAPAWR